MKPIAGAALLLGAAALLHADPATDAAAHLYHAKKYSEAGAALAKIVQAQPRNAEACDLLGLSLLRAGGNRAQDDAFPWIERAVKLEPNNPSYVGDYGGVCLQLADRHRSYTFAIRGRDAMLKAIALDPQDLDVRMGLMRFYAQAPWPLGSASKARAQAEEISRRDPSRALHAYLALGQSFEKKGSRSEARAAYAAALHFAPGNPDATAALARLHQGAPSP